MNRVVRALPVAVALLVTGALLVAGAEPAAAQAPDRTGWWSTAPTDLSAAPSSTPADGLHLANGPHGQLAFAAVSYHLPPLSSARLTVRIAANTLVGTPAVVACPTVSDTWRAGGDQPAATAPAYTCRGRSVPALVSSDSTGMTLSFLLDDNQELSPGVLSLALLPSPVSTAPFSLDLLAPGPGALVTQQVSAAQPPAAAPSALPARTPEARADPRPPAAPVPALVPFDAALPVLAALPGVAPALAPALAPLLAAGPLPAPPALAAPRLLRSAQQRRLGTDNRANQAVLLVLVLLVGGVGYLIGHNTELPLRLLGGRAPRVDPDAPVLAGPDAPLGGLGRFARARTGPPRKLT